ncbi:LipA and NB-ARC domain protein [Metarhizium acridum CQMa 102]|uniref:LipA and NB-ARC domain protein n=1 Tax=Metarhizium acridum (strain CQMa 102) TaxID=655827 RepID=E9EHN0_METAQ|nr:LipA and NB-ARC domain protein [Metarhizium acridum CQMa 102]EFY84564.1 LipA and NB-ARC domain protein [Metarhizium acridum CQMa 102]
MGVAPPEFPELALPASEAEYKSNKAPPARPRPVLISEQCRVQMAPHDEIYSVQQVYTPSVGEPDINIVAVHGLDGDARKTWTTKGSQVFWLDNEQFLPKYIKNARQIGGCEKAMIYAKDRTARQVSHEYDIFSSTFVCCHYAKLSHLLLLEEQKTDLKFLGKDYIVSVESAAPKFDLVERAGIAADHSGIVKLGDPNSQAFKMVIDALLRYTEEAAPIIRQRTYDAVNLLDSLRLREVVEAVGGQDPRILMGHAGVAMKDGHGRQKSHP